MLNRAAGGPTKEPQGLEGRALRFCGEVEATTGFEPVNGGFANLWLTTCLRRQASIAATGPAWSSPQLLDCLIHHPCTPLDDGALLR